MRQHHRQHHRTRKRADFPLRCFTRKNLINRLMRQSRCEQANGNCRLMAPFAEQLAETASTWRKAVAPYAEQAARIFWQGRPKKSRFALPTRLTQARQSIGKTGKLMASVPPIPKTYLRCPVCGTTVTTGSTYCRTCVSDVNRENMLKQVKLGRIATHSPIAEARRSATQVRQAEAQRQWNPSELPKWLDEDAYRREILPRLAKFTVKAIRLSLDVSYPYATLIKRGLKIPHPRHWMPLAELVGYRK